MALFLAFRSENKSLSQQAPSFSPLSEYAPPPNPSAHHLIASNPFDDDYSSPSLKPLPHANPYIGHPHWFSGYGPPRMPPRMPSPYGAPYQMRNQPHPLSQNHMGSNRTPGFNYSENPNCGQPLSSSSNNVMHFRPRPGEHANLHNLNQRASPGGPDFGPEGNPSPQITPNNTKTT
ncbi:pygopus homolog 1-like [Cyprinus carpio]|uniref:Pygopus homolog 1-like n=1 Tax=Cyprinus carpio TaxID=7962 RepID=A0A9R0AIR4_CYPCA|nr:pygopus homolog 1-like [Cyprinus carpio]